MTQRLLRWIVACAFICAALVFIAATTPMCRGSERVQVGSKVFTESVILGELATQLGRDAGVDTVHRTQLGGTRVLWEALCSGQIDAYPEYTGTIAQELIPGTPTAENALRAALAKRGVGMTHSLGFNDTYALGMPDALAARFNIGTIDDLRAHPELRLGFSNEFIDRKDGWSPLRTAYALPQLNVTGLDHDLAYRAVSYGKCDVIDLYSTDAEIAFYHLRVLEDDRHVFPRYEAVYLYRLELNRTVPAFVKAIARLEGAIDAPHMIAMNAAAKLNHVPESQVASEFLSDRFHIKTESHQMNWMSRLLMLTRQHLLLVSISLSASIVAAVPLGVAAFQWPRLGHVILAVVAVIYTIPALALLVFMIPLLGIGTWPAIVALFLYGLLPIVRNTHAGLAGISPSLRESAIVLGLSPTARLLRVELPMAAPSILAGIKTAAVINVGTATLGALIGAGGYGQPILTGIRLADNRLILFGAVPAAILALLVQGGFGLLERIVVPRGLRLKTRS
jgi:osmoprotectant transport system permease protein